MTIVKFINEVGFKVREGDVKKVNGTISDIKSTATKLLGAIGIGFSLTKINALVEEFGRVNEQVKNSTAALGDQAEIQKKIMESARQTRSSYAETAGVISDLVHESPELFGNIDEAVKFNNAATMLFKSAGKTNEDIAGLMEAINKSFAKGYVDSETISQLLERSPEAVELLNKKLGTTSDTAKHTGGIVAPSLIQYHTEQTENVRASGLGAPIPTVDASNRYGLTCANLVKYYSGVVGEKMEEPLPTVTAIDHNAVCAAHVVKFKGNEVGTRPTDALPTQTSAGVFALCDTLLCKAGPDDNLYRWPMIRDLLNRYCGYELADDDLLLLNIGGTLYFIADIGLRMLSPRELYNAMGFPPDYIIDRDYMGNPYPKNEQVARCGNAVCPPMAAAVARANFPEYVAKVGDTITTMAACWTWWRCRKEQRHGQKEIDGAGRAVSVQG